MLSSIKAVFPFWLPYLLDLGQIGATWSASGNRLLAERDLCISLNISVDDRNFASAHIPYLRFDGGAKAKHCWPDEAKDSNDGKCKDFNSKAPIYYDVVDCADKFRKVSFAVLALNILRIKIKTLSCSFYSPPPRDRVQRLKWVLIHRILCFHLIMNLSMLMCK